MDVYLLSYTFKLDRSYSVESGNYSDLMSYLRAIKYDGATKIGAL